MCFSHTLHVNDCRLRSVLLLMLSDSAHQSCRHCRNEDAASTAVTANYSDSVPTGTLLPADYLLTRYEQHCRVALSCSTHGILTCSPAFFSSLHSSTCVLALSTTYLSVAIRMSIAAVPTQLPVPVPIDSLLLILNIHALNLLDIGCHANSCC